MRAEFSDSTLDLHPLTVVEHAPEATIQERFEAFVAANEGVIADLIALADEARRNGEKRIGIKALFERLRWSHVRTHGTDGFKLNNSYSSRVARLICERRPDLADLFETRKLRAA